MTESASRDLARDSHYVPAAMLRRWSDDDTHVFACRLLVSSSRVPLWSRRAIRGIAYRRDLYTVFKGGQELDELERWLGTEFEHPGLEAVDRLLDGARLTPQDWKRMARLVAAQDVRTPLSFLESMRRWDREIPELLNQTLEEAAVRLEARQEFEPPGPGTRRDDSEFAGLFRISIEPPKAAESDQTHIRAEVPVGRGLWVASIRHTLRTLSEVLCDHRWSVAEPYGEEEWPLTDHPVLRLNYYTPGHYDFGGGWGNLGSEIIMPLSPTRLLYVKVGSKAPNRFAFSEHETRLVQQLIVERAHRWVFGTRPLEWVGSMRPRIIDAERFKAEEAMWKNWHRDQLQSEISSETAKHGPANPPSRLGKSTTIRKEWACDLPSQVFSTRRGRRRCRVDFRDRRRSGDRCESDRERGTGHLRGILGSG